MDTKQPKQLNADEHVLNAHNFNITDRESIFFSADKVHVEYAELFIDDMLMSVVVIGKGKPVSADIVPESCQLAFFGDIPLHRALLKCPVRVVIHTYDDGLPALCMQMVETLTWEAIDASELVVNVSVATRNGPVEKKMMYCTLYAGYLPDTPKTTPTTNDDKPLPMTFTVNL